ncbi:hypothetical protein [Streptomyces asiaticus]
MDRLDGCKLGFAVFPLATVLLGHGSSGSFLDAGIVAGAWSVGGTATAPLRGRLVDRHGQRWPMGAMAVLTALASSRQRRPYGPPDSGGPSPGRSWWRAAPESTSGH